MPRGVAIVMLEFFTEICRTATKNLTLVILMRAYSPQGCMLAL
jgi:hypothetical protein